MQQGNINIEIMKMYNQEKNYVKTFFKDKKALYRSFNRKREGWNV